MLATTELPANLRDVLDECKAFLNSVDSTSQRVCCEWVSRPFRERHGREMRPQHLAQLARLGFLTKENATRGGARRYYCVVQQN
jgi:hypothetical protein